MTDDLERRIAREMAWLSSRAAAIDRPLQRIWILTVLLASGLLLVLTPLLDALPFWTAAPGLAMALLVLLARLPPAIVPARLGTLAATWGVAALVAPGILLRLLNGGRRQDLHDMIGAALRRPPSAGPLRPLGETAPWREAAILDLETGAIHARSAHARLAAAAGAAARPIPGDRLPGRWLATDGTGTVALFSEGGNPLAHRRLPLPLEPT